MASSEIHIDEAISRLANELPDNWDELTVTFLGNKGDLIGKA